MQNGNTVNQHAFETTSPDDMQHLGDVAARAFFDDPLSLWMVPKADTRLQHLQTLYRSIVRYALQAGDFYATAELHGMAMWLRPGATSITFGQMLRSGLPQATIKVGLGNTRRFLRYAGAIEKWQHEDLPDDHWYLMTLAVDPDHQGQGHGTRLMRPVLEQADADGLHCYLETLNARNLPLYERNGFAVVAERKFAEDAPRVWCMVRRPQA